MNEVSLGLRLPLYKLREGNGILKRVSPRFLPCHPARRVCGVQYGALCGPEFLTNEADPGDAAFIDLSRLSVKGKL